MGDRSGHDPSRPARWAQTVGERARGAERDLLRAVDRLPMEGTAQGSAAEEHGARLSRALELGESITRCTWPCARRRDVKQARRWRSSTRRPRRALKKGVLA